MTRPTQRNTLIGVFAAVADKNPTRPAVQSDGDTEAYTYAELAQAVTRLSGHLRALGVQPGDRVVCQLGTCAHTLISAFATWQCGAIHVTADPDLTAEELTQRVRVTAAAACVLRLPDDRAVAAAVTGPLTDRFPELALIDAGHGAPTLGHHRLVDLLHTDASAVHTATDAPLPAPDDPAVILFTSGTTGTPKGVVRYHEQLVTAWLNVGDTLAAKPADVHLAQLPLAHGFGLGLAVMGLLTGGSVIVAERFSPCAILRLITASQVTICHGTPAHFALLVDHLRTCSHDVSSWRCGQASAARFPTDSLRRVLDELSITLQLLYGMSEGLNCWTTDRDDMLLGAVGRPRPERVRIVAPDHTLVRDGETGEVAFRKVHRFAYWGEPQPTTAADSEWYYTGDRGRRDDQGRLFVLGRVRYQINRGGLRIDPEEVERRLEGCPGVTDSAVVGLGDPVLGEIVCACIVTDFNAAAVMTAATNPDDAPALDMIRQFLAPHLAQHKLPEAVWILESIPRTALGKTDRQALHTRITTATQSTRPALQRLARR